MTAIGLLLPLENFGNDLTFVQECTCSTIVKILLWNVN